VTVQSPATNTSAPERQPPVRRVVMRNTLRAVPEAGAPLPAISRPLLRWFTWYSRRYLRRHFHSLRVSFAGLPDAGAGLPLVIYANHASWWDALVGLVLKDEFLSERKAFAPIDAEMLKNYKMFARLGFFGVERGLQAASITELSEASLSSGSPRNARTLKRADGRVPSRRGAVQFLRTTETILRDPNSLLVITPQGRFADVRERPVHFEAGLGRLATRVERAIFLPMATEFVFWEERLPEILVHFGEPVEAGAHCAAAFNTKYWTMLFEQKMAAAQDDLAAAAQRRNPDEFQVVLRGGGGQGGIYDWWRAAKARMHGETFRKEHGTK
jgi:1-acyl-sn-glycerol-3-phosphate acyltransferase